MKTRYQNVYIESLGIALPSRIVTSQEIEQKLSPLYERLGLHTGRLELMTGIQERRLGDAHLKPSQLSTQAAQEALSQSNIPLDKIGCLIHTSVCRDFLEPATATVVHQNLSFKSHCQVFDLSDACLGWMDGIVMVANMIELGQIEAGLVVSGEDGRALVETTIENLNLDLTMTRQSIKGRIASLTIGSGGSAVLLTSKSLNRSGHQLLGASSMCATQYNHLCQGGVDTTETTRSHVDMITDSEALLQAGVGLAAQNWRQCQELFNWTQKDVDHFITHQVGSAHRNLLFEKLELDLQKDYSSFQHLGNMGTASIGVTLSLAEKEQRFSKGDHISLMGIGSGLVSMMMGIKW